MYTYRRSTITKVCLALLAGLLVAGMSSRAQVRVTKITGSEGQTGKNGILYALPRTVLVVDLTITRTDRVPGPYASLAQELLGIDNVADQPSTVYALEAAQLSAYVEPDPQQVFLLELDEKASEEVLLEFTESGMLAGAGMLPEDENDLPGWIGDYREPVLDPATLFPYYREASMKEVIDTITREVTFDTLTYREKILKRMMVKQSDREKASEASAMIHDIGQDQYSLLVGYQETAYSYEAMKYMYDQLEAQRRNYLQLFTGITRQEKFRVRRVVVPDEEMFREPYVLAGFSEESGVSDAGEGREIQLAFQKHGLASLAAPTDPAAATQGYHYRIPDKCRVSVVFDGMTLTGEDMVVNQAGVVRALPSRVTRVSFDPMTGAVRKMVLK